MTCICHNLNIAWRERVGAEHMMYAGYICHTMSAIKWVHISASQTLDAIELAMSLRLCIDLLYCGRTDAMVVQGSTEGARTQITGEVNTPETGSHWRPVNAKLAFVVC